MNDGKSGLIKSLPLAVVLLLVGGALGYFGWQDPLKAGVIALLCGIGGLFVGLQMQLLGNTASNNQDQLGDQMGAAMDRGFKGFADTLKANEQALTSLSDQLTTGVGANADQMKAMLDQHAQSLSSGLEQTTQSLTSKLDTTATGFANTLNSSTLGISDAFSGSTTGLTEQYASSADRLATVMEEHTRAMQQMATDLSAMITNSYAEGADMFKQALSTHIEQVNAASVDWHEEYKTVLEGYTGQINETSQVLTDRLKEVAVLGQDVNKLLHANDAIDGALKSIGAADEFKATLVSFKDHLEKSDELLKEATKPRRISFVEAQGD